MTTISTLTIEMAANVARIQQDMDRARKVVDDAMGRIGGAVEGAQRAFGLLAAAAGGATFGMAIKNAINLADQMDELAEKTGIAAKTLSSMRYAGEAAGTPMESMTKGLQKLSQNMYAAAVGGKEQAETFARLGVSVQTSSGAMRGSDEVLRDLADRFSDMQNGPAKAALAMDVFGKAGVDMVPLLNQGSDGLEDLHDEALRLGGVIGNDFAKQSADFNDSLTKMRMVSEGFMSSLAQQLLPTLNRLAEAFLGAQSAGSPVAEFLGKALKTAIETVAILGANLVFVFQGIWRELTAIYEKAKALINLDFAKFENINIKLNLDNEKAAADLEKFEQTVMGWGGRGAGYSDPRAEKMASDLRGIALKEEAEALKLFEEQQRLKRLAEEAHKARLRQIEEERKAQAKLVDEGVKLSESFITAQAGLSTDFASKWDALAAAFGAGRLSADQLAVAQAKLIEQQPFMKKAAEDRQKAQKAQIDMDQKAIDSVQSEIDAIRKSNEAMALHNEEIGLTTEQLDMLRLKRLDHEIAVQSGIVAEYEEARAMGTVTGQMQQQINKLDELTKKRNLTATGQMAQATVDAAKKAEDEWKRTADKIESALTDALMRGFENGKGFGENMRDTIVNMFKTMVLRPVVQAAVQPLANSLQTAMFGGPGQQQNMMSGLSNLSSLGSFFDTGGSLLGGLAGSSASYGAALGTTSIGAGSQAAMLAAQTAEFGTAGLSATAGAAGSGAMASMAAAAPYIAAALAVYQIAKTLDTSGTIHTGGSASYSAAGGAQTNIGPGRTGFAYTDRSTQTEGLAAGMAQSIVGLLDTTAAAFGKTAGYTAATAFADDSSRDGAWGSLILSKGGKDLLNWADNRQSRWAPREFGNGEEGLKQYMTAVSKDVRDMLMADTPGWADAMLQALGDAPTLDQLAGVVQQISAIQNIFKQFGDAIPQLKGLSDDAVGSLMALAGGVGNLQQGLATYQNLFYSEAEKQALATKQVADAMSSLGLAMPDSDAAYRKLVEAQDMTTESGRRQWTALIALAPAFEQVTAASQKAADAAISEAQAKAKATADQRAGLQNQLDDLIGNSAALRERERAAIDASNLALYDQIEATKAAQAAAQQRQSLQDQLDELTGDTTALKARERAAIDSSNLALYDQIQAIQAAKVAQDDYNASLDAAQSALASATASVAAAQQSVDGIRQQATSGYLSALEQVAAVQEQIAEQARQTAGTYRDLAKQLREYVTGVIVPPGDTFAKALTKALGGDREAMSSLPGLATSATDSARQGAGNSAAFRLDQARILAGVMAAADKAASLGIETPAQQAASLQQKLIDAQAKLAQALSTANAISAPLVQTQSTLVTQYQAALQALTAAQNQQAQSQATLDAIQKNTKDTAMATADWPGKIAANFSQLDTSLNGLLTVDELRAAMAGKATDAQIVAMMGLLDTNNDGVISQLEAQLGAARSLPMQIQQSLAGKFDALTATTAGLLNFSQFRTQFAGLASDSTLYSIFRELDTNGDGSISRLESIKHSTEKTAVGVSSYGAGPAGVSEFERLYWAITTYGSANVDASNGVNNSVIHMTLLTRLRLEDIYNRLGSTLNVTSVNRAGTAAYFATGGVFTNSVVSRPTAFDFGVMGEAGPEAILPLTNVGGSLGVRAQMPGSDELVNEVRALRAGAVPMAVQTRADQQSDPVLRQLVADLTEQVANLRIETRAGVSANQEHLAGVKRMTRNFQAAPVTGLQNDPLKVQVLA